MNEIPKGLCQCGCGQATRIAPQNHTKKGWEKGIPVRFIPGHHSWKGGRRIDQSGYVLIMLPDHPRANSRGYVFEHILVLEKALGRSILPTEASHHRNRTRSDNSPGNLMLFKTKGMHSAFHERLRAFEASGHYDWRQCTICHKFDAPGNVTISSCSVYHKPCKAIESQRYKVKLNARKGL